MERRDDEPAPGFDTGFVKVCISWPWARAFEGADKNVVGQDHSVALKNKAAEISSQLKGTSIFLVGINNNIKAKLGNVLADMLRYYYFDSDSLVEQAAGGEAAAKSFREKDDKGFLESETEVLRQLSSMGRLVICTGDGAVKSSTNLSFMRHGISIWIDVPIVVLAKEVKESGNQPPPDDVILNSDPSKAVAKLTELFERMRGGYATADATISLQKVASQLGYDDTDAVTIEDMAMEVKKQPQLLTTAFREIEKLTRVKKMMEAAARPF
ncbi:hypothetical protein IFM89_033922 [Coptis chinensis]|uniref:Inactive shikimate kinase like 1, chloroplastic n=1 Tax=Coptis chinensis TaxID=261450 RepID=A0A835HY79_9MAGN|nr:hypothetical protein IFM89_033922 [Coptis chinensis]